MDGMEMPTLAPTENVYEILDHSTARDESVLLRTESQVCELPFHIILASSIQDSIAQEKLAAQNSTRELPDFPSTSNENPYSETP